MKLALWSFIILEQVDGERVAGTQSWGYVQNITEVKQAFMGLELRLLTLSISYLSKAC
jgi:hypothetical protein